MKLDCEWIGILQDVIKSYNTSYHRGIGMQPPNVDISNAADIYDKYYRQKISRKRPLLRKGDSVRISLDLGLFSKNYEQSFSRQVYRVASDAIYPENGIYPKYKIQSLNGRDIPGKYYSFELLHVNTRRFVDDYVFPIEKILKRKKGKVFVKYLGYSNDDNSWISEKSLKKAGISKEL